MTTGKALAVALLSATLAAGTLAGPAPSASADTPRCATFQEFRQVQSVLNGGGDGGAGISFDGGSNRVAEKRWNGYV